MIPKMDGYEICMAIREDNEISSAPIIIISAKDDQFDKIKGIETDGECDLRNII